MHIARHKCIEKNNSIQSMESSVYKPSESADSSPCRLAANQEGPLIITSSSKENLWNILVEDTVDLSESRDEQRG